MYKKKKKNNAHLLYVLTERKVIRIIDCYTCRGHIIVAKMVLNDCTTICALSTRNVVKIGLKN